MAKITLEFDSFEESEEAQTAINANKWKCSIWELEQYYRSIYKYSEKGEEIEMAEKVREKIREILNSNELFL
jgi:hypothetical protein